MCDVSDPGEWNTTEFVRWTNRNVYHSDTKRVFIKFCENSEITGKELLSTPDIKLVQYLDPNGQLKRHHLDAFTKQFDELRTVHKCCVSRRKSRDKVAKIIQQHVPGCGDAAHLIAEFSSETPFPDERRWRKEEIMKPFVFMKRSDAESGKYKVKEYILAWQPDRRALVAKKCGNFWCIGIVGTYLWHGGSDHRWEYRRDRLGAEARYRNITNKSGFKLTQFYYGHGGCNWHVGYEGREGSPDAELIYVFANKWHFSGEEETCKTVIRTSAWYEFTGEDFDKFRFHCDYKWANYMKVTNLPIDGTKEEYQYWQED